jgi:hypothetical protein
MMRVFVEWWSLIHLTLFFPLPLSPHFLSLAFCRTRSRAWRASTASILSDDEP